MRVGYEISRKQFRQMFLDKAPIQKALTKTRQRAWNRAGGAIRTAARRNVRNRRRPSRSGEGPTNRTRILRDNIFYGVDLSTMSLVVGPAIVPSAGRGVDASDTIPAVLEYGGEVSYMEILDEATGRWRPPRHAGERTSPRRTRRKVVKRIAARPYMNPALEAILPRVPDFFREAAAGG